MIKNKKIKQIILLAPLIYWCIVLFAILMKEGSVLFNDALNTFSYGYMASGIW